MATVSTKAEFVASGMHLRGYNLVGVPTKTTIDKIVLVHPYAYICIGHSIKEAKIMVAMDL